MVSSDKIGVLRSSHKSSNFSLGGPWMADSSVSSGLIEKPGGNATSSGINTG